MVLNLMVFFFSIFLIVSITFERWQVKKTLKYSVSYKAKKVFTILYKCSNMEDDMLNLLLIPGCLPPALSSGELLKRI